MKYLLGTLSPKKGSKFRRVQGLGFRVLGVFARVLNLWDVLLGVWGLGFRV